MSDNLKIKNYASKYRIKLYFGDYKINKRSEARVKNALQKIISSGLFDKEWYATAYPHTVKADITPELHYVLKGANEGLDPNPLFHTNFYLEKNIDISRNNVNPLIHYIEHGAKEGRNPNALFDTHWYIEKYMNGIQNDINPLAHFLVSHNNPSPRFDADWYAKTYGLAALPTQKILGHYFEIGEKQNFFPTEADYRHFEYQVNKISDSLVFNKEFYIATYPDVDQTALRPAEHYYLYGAKEGRVFSSIFNLGHYSQQCPFEDFRTTNPVLHYLDVGAAMGLSPSIWFDAPWYMKTYPSWLSSGLTPLGHFILQGGLETSPSARFDGLAYYRDYPEVAQANINPLEHYLNHGMKEGRRIRHIGSTASGSKNVSKAKLVTLKACRSSREQTAVMVSHAPSGKIKGHVEHYIKFLVKYNISVILVVAADQRKTQIPQSIIDLCEGVYVRENSGFDFAAWAHVISRNEFLLSKETLFLLNDSLIGPVDQHDFKKVIEKIRDSRADIIGLTDNYHYAWHIQSFFLALKSNCLCSYGFNKYLQDVAILDNKDAVILEYELTFSMQMIATGLSVEVLFPMKKASDSITTGPGLTDREHNRTILAWDWMLGSGFPFIKGSLINGEHKYLFGDAPRTALMQRDFEVERLDPAYFYDGDRQWADLESEPTSCFPLNVSFIAPTPYKNGLGVAARSYLRALHRTPWNLNVHPIEAPFHVHARVAPSWQTKTFAGPADVVLIHVNGEGWNNLLSDDQKCIVAEASTLIGLFVWETSVVPADWLPNINRLDAIWVPTEFCAEIFRKVTDIPVHVVPYVVENEASLQSSSKTELKLRNSYGLDPKRRIILYAFDGSSFLARKNPHALIDAFRTSRLYEHGWQLVLKTKHVFDLPMEGKRLFDKVGGAQDVKVIDQPMTDRDFRTLFGLCSIYASSHSSEGFGLTIAEAMELNKVVVATDYGGSRDFLDETCGFPVKAKVVKLSESYGPYMRGSEWGEVDEADLVRALCAAASAEAHSTVGAAAKARIRARLSAETVARAMVESLEQIIPTAIKDEQTTA